jgi:hypothetical protein
MVTPPRFEQPTRKKESRTALWVTLVLACGLLPCLGVLGFVGYGYLFFKNNVSPMIQCTMTFQGLRDAALAYADKNGGKLPVSATWQDDIRPYYKEVIKTIVKAPFSPQSADETWGCPGDKPGIFTGIAFNSELSGVALKTITSPSTTVIFFETAKPVKNEALPYTPRPISTSPKLFGEPRGWMKIEIEGDLDDTSFSVKSKRSRN